LIGERLIGERFVGDIVKIISSEIEKHFLLKLKINKIDLIFS